MARTYGLRGKIDWSKMPGGRPPRNRSARARGKRRLMFNGLYHEDRLKMEKARNLEGLQADGLTVAL